MKLIQNKENFVIYIITPIKNDKEDLKKYIKETILKIKRKYKKDISGFYDVEVYTNNKIGMIIELKKEEGLELYQDIIDLNIKIHKEPKIYLEFDDIFIVEKFDNIYTKNNRYYIDSDNVDKNTFLKIIEFTNFIYGENLEKLKTNLKLVVKNSKL